MKFTKEEYDLLYSKLESRFKKSGSDLVEKIKANESLTEDEADTILKKLE